MYMFDPFNELLKSNINIKSFLIIIIINIFHIDPVK